MNWYFREATVAMLVTNLPLTWSLIRDWVPGLQRWAYGGSNDFVPNTWPSKSSRTAGGSKRSRELGLQTFDQLDSNAENEKAGAASIVTDVADCERSDENDDYEHLGNHIHVQKDIILDVEKARAKESSGYPVWDWRGNPDHVSSTEVAGGRL